jgi:hypothetical protein
MSTKSAFAAGRGPTSRRAELLANLIEEGAAKLAAFVETLSEAPPSLRSSRGCSLLLCRRVHTSQTRSSHFSSN